MNCPICHNLMIIPRYGYGNVYCLEIERPSHNVIYYNKNNWTASFTIISDSGKSVILDICAADKLPTTLTICTYKISPVAIDVPSVDFSQCQQQALYYYNKYLKQMAFH